MGVDRFIYENRYMIARISAYYNIPKEELYQDICLCYYENPEIDKLFNSGYKRKASSIMGVLLRRELQKYSPSGIRLIGHDAYLKAIESRAKNQNSFDLRQELQKSLEETIEDNELLEFIQTIISKEDYRFLLSHYGAGGSVNALMYKINIKTENKRVSRLLAKIRDGLCI